MGRIDDLYLCDIKYTGKGKIGREPKKKGLYKYNFCYIVVCRKMFEGTRVY